MDVDETNGCVRRVTVHDEEVGSMLPDQDTYDVVSMHVPYFGVIRISSGSVSKKVLTRPTVASNESTLPINSGSLNLAALTSTRADHNGTACLTI